MPEPVTAALLVLGARSVSPLARIRTDGAARRRTRLPGLPRSASLSKGPPAPREKPHRHGLCGVHPSLPAAGTSLRSPRRGRTAAALPQTCGFRACVHGRAGGEVDGQSDERTDGRMHPHPYTPPRHTWASPRPTQPLPPHGTHRVAQRRLLAEHGVPHGREGVEGTLPPHGAAAAAATLGAALPSDGGRAGLPPSSLQPRAPGAPPRNFCLYPAPGCPHPAAEASSPSAEPGGSESWRSKRRWRRSRTPLEGRRFQSSRPAPVTPPRWGRPLAPRPCSPRGAQPSRTCGTSREAGVRRREHPSCWGCWRAEEKRGAAPGLADGSVPGSVLNSYLDACSRPAGRGALRRSCPKAATAWDRPLQRSRPSSPPPGKASDQPSPTPRCTWSLTGRPRSCKRGPKG